MHTVERIELKSRALTLEVMPQWGGRVARLRAVKGDHDILVPLHEREFDPLAWPRAGAYPLIPYSNRIENACLLFDGARFELPAHPNAIPHTLHGVSHTLPWTVVEANGARLIIALEFSGDEWPWPFRAEQRFHLVDDELRHELSVTNLGDTPMPAGIGLHPYFRLDASSTISFDARTLWSVGADYLPNGERTEPKQPMRISGEDATNREVLAYLSGWNGKAKIACDAGTVELSAGADLSHLVAFAPKGAAYLCLEPVSHVANGFNLHASGVDGTGTRTLAPGETLSESIVFRWLPR